MSSTKVCLKCKEEKPVTEFYRNKGDSQKTGRHSYCKPCLLEYKKQWYSANKQDYLQYTRDYHYQTQYGMSEAEAKELKKECQVCGRKDGQLCIDHCHKTGKVRGVLCHRCNTTLGKVNEDVAVLQAMIRYLNG